MDQKLSKEDFDKLRMTVKMLLHAYPGEVDPIKIAVYMEDLMGYPVEDVKTVCKLLRRKLKFLPTIADIVEELAALDVERKKERKQVASIETQADMAKWKREPPPPAVKAIIDAALAKSGPQAMPTVTKHEEHVDFDDSM